MSPGSRFHPMHVERSGSFTLPMAIRHAFPLFTPEGERAWVAGWDPEYLHPDHPSIAAGTVFRTAHKGEETLWLVLDYDPHTWTARYCRVTPGSRMGTVAVQCEAAGEGATVVRVQYALTSLSTAGNAVLHALTPAAYAKMMEEWRELILASPGAEEDAQ